ncbi:MAG: flavin reductase [Flavobacteriaceae bacterium]|nr:flavin reductase [Flavobacteriaceae bacterium]
MNILKRNNIQTLDLDQSVWSQTFMVAPLVVIGTKEGTGYDMAPKHMVSPIGFDNYFGFVCTPRHMTYTNLQKTKEFTVSFLLPEQVLMASLSATPRHAERSKSKNIISALPTFRASSVDALFIADSYLFLECELFKVIDGFNENSIITGKITAAFANENYLKLSEKDEQLQLMKNPLLAYIAEGRFAKIKETYNFPFPKDFER